MKCEYLYRDGNSTRLLLFFGGWGAEPAIFRNSVRPSSGCDVLLCYDYTSLDLDRSIFENYAETDVLAWSLGVWVAAVVLDKIELDGRRIAVNGTLRPKNDRFGIPEAVFDGTIFGFSEANYARFLRRMCGSRSALSAYEVFDRVRNAAGLLLELSALDGFIAGNAVPDGFRWDLSVVGEKDLIFPAANQIVAWSDAGVPIEKRDVPHYDGKLFEELLDINSVLWTRS